MPIPSPVLDTTVGGEYSTSYVDVDFADNYWANHYSVAKASVWNKLPSDDTKTQLLILACKQVETARFTLPVVVGFNPLGINSNYQLMQDPTTGKFHYRWVVTTEPVRYYYNQALQFPRNLDIHTSGVVFIPWEMLFAQCEQALYMCTLDESALEAQRQGVTLDSITAGNNAISLHRRFSGDGTAFSPIALQYMNKYLLKWSVNTQRA